MRHHRSLSPKATEELGRRCASLLQPGAVIGLIGELGSGKTQFVVGLCAGLGVNVPVTSPTFTLINEYPAPFGAVIHVDLYRINALREIAELGLDEYVSDRTICLIEWAEKLENRLPPGAKLLHFFHGQTERERVVEFPEGLNLDP